MAGAFRNAMAYLGLSEREDEYEDLSEEYTQVVQPVRPAEPLQTQERAQVAPLSRKRQAVAAAPSGMSEISTMHPHSFQDAKQIGERFREGVPVIINLSEVVAEDAQRILDFSIGLSMGLHGKIEKVTSKVYLLTPAHVSVTGEDEVAPVQSDSYFN